MTQNHMPEKSIHLQFISFRRKLLKQMTVNPTFIKLPRQPSFIKPCLAAALLCAAPLLVLAQAPAQARHGTVPRAAATDYATHNSLKNDSQDNSSAQSGTPENTSQSDIQIGAALLTKKELQNALASKVSECCLVVEVALYPPKNNFVRISVDNFMLRERGMDLGTSPSTSSVVAARIQETPVQPDREHTPGVSRGSEIGYERTGGTSPTDQAGNQQSNRGGIYQRDSVGIGIPVGGSSQNTPRTNEGAAAAAAGNRQAIEAELGEKSLPQMDAWEPVAGYLYFSIPKRSKNGYELVYTVGDKKVVLALK
jgi:hypothetical protein